MLTIEFAVCAAATQLEDVLEEMHALAREAQTKAAALAPDAAADRGPLGLRRSPTDEAMQLSAPLRAYEAELAMKHWIAKALRAKEVSSSEAASLLIAWESQPLLQPVDGMRAAAREQAALEQQLKTG